MTYYKKIERDKARCKHIEEMDRIQYKLAMFYFDSEGFAYWQKRLLLLEKQLKLYDKIMGYDIEL